MRFLFAFLFAASGCFEGQKPNPLPSATAAPNLPEPLVNPILKSEDNPKK